MIKKKFQYIMNKWTILIMKKNNLIRDVSKI